MLEKVMSIQKEREEFEQAVKESCGLSAESSFELGPTGEYKSDATYFGWFMWLQAKRKIQAVPEGFVLVPKDPTKKMLASVHEAGFFHGNRAPTTVYKLMIEAAQEQSHDSK